MHKNLIDITITAEDLAALDTALTAQETLLSFAASLEVTERSALYKIGPGTEVFAARILDLAKRNPDLLPRGLDLTAIERDKVAREQLVPRLDRMRQMTERLSHVVMLLGSDYLGGTRSAYRSMQANGKAAGIEELLADIGKCFAKTRTPAAPTAPATGSGTGTTPPAA
ncbi:MAG: hypothetical protein EOP84_19130 [Verrucomicrobiaceae bacterium]|nr:MAG: hypothetical protein EOP84_19130 [Verrucomicrobiaceae bacterium]